MRILVISDSHGGMYQLESVLSSFANTCGAIIHTGDGCDDLMNFTEYTSGKIVYTIKGNCDMYAVGFCPDFVETELDGRKFFACHGHKYNVKGGLGTLYYAAKEKNADICLYGHTHKQKLDCEDGMIILNPGSVSKGDYAVIETFPQKTVVKLYGIEGLKSTTSFQK